MLRNTLDHSIRVAGRHSLIAKDALPVVLHTFEVLEKRSECIAIDATTMFMREAAGFSSFALSVGGVVDRIHSIGVSEFDSGIEVWGVQVYDESVRSQFEDWPGYSGDRLDVKVHWTLIFLDGDLLAPRISDARVGFGAANESRNRWPANPNEPIRRWRLDKSEPLQQTSEAVVPIRVYLDSSIPARWRPWIKEGIESWGWAFEEIGLRDAILVLDEPTGDPEFFLKSGRHTVVEWRPPSGSQFRFDRVSMKPGVGVRSTHDFRSGEIRSARIIVSWPGDLFLTYFAIACGPALGGNVSTREIIDRISPYYLKSGVAHEFGHVLGLMDGNYGEGAYLTSNLRDEDWLRENGFSPSVMNYSRCNYAAQPEDQVGYMYLVPRVGPADVHNIAWGYSEVSGLASPDEEAARLESILAEQLTKPWLRFSSWEAPKGPQTFNNAIDVRDVVKGSDLGLRNVRRSLSRLGKEIESGQLSDAEALRFYYAAVDIWATMIEHASSVVGGVEVHSLGAYQPGAVVLPIEGDRVDRAIDFVLKEIMRPDDQLTLRSLDERVGAKHGADFQRIMRSNLIVSLLAPYRLNRLAELDKDRPEREILGKYLDQVIVTLFGNSINGNGRVEPTVFPLQQAAMESMSAAVGGEDFNYIRDERISYWSPAVSIFGQPEEASAATKALLKGKMYDLCRRIETSIAKVKSDHMRGQLLLLQEYCG